MKTLIKTIILSALVTCSGAAMAAQGDYKIMVIEQANTTPDAFESSFNTCALNVQSKNYSLAEASCSQALALLKEVDAPRAKVRELTAFALSNRGVGRLMAKNDTAALSDLYEAQQISKSTLVAHNLIRAKQYLSL